MKTAQDHLAWAKGRALEYVDQGNVPDALASIGSDLRKHPDTAGHGGLELMGMLMLAGHLQTPAQAREFIEGLR